MNPAEIPDKVLTTSAQEGSVIDMTNTAATSNWYPTAQQIAESGDQFLGWSTQTLIGIAERVTPNRELDRWVATAGAWVWNAAEQMWERLERNEATGRMDATASYGDDTVREFVIEQLEHYGTTRADVAFMKS